MCYPTSAFGNFKSLASPPQPKISETRHAVPTAVPGRRLGLRAGALGGVGCSCRGAAATAAVKPPLATPPACASHAHGRHRLPIGHDTGLARAVRTLHRSTRLLTCARAFSRRHVGPSLWGVAVLGVNYVSKLVRTRAWYSTFQPVFPTGESARRGPWWPPFTMRKEGQGRKRC
jgi:hypothetical protein